MDPLGWGREPTGTRTAKSRGIVRAPTPSPLPHRSSLALFALLTTALSGTAGKAVQSGEHSGLQQAYNNGASSSSDS